MIITTIEGGLVQGVELFGTRFEAKRKAGWGGSDSGPEGGRKRRRKVRTA